MFIICLYIKNKYILTRMFRANEKKLRRDFIDVFFWVFYGIFILLFFLFYFVIMLI